MKKIYKIILFTIIGLFLNHWASAQNRHLADSIVRSFFENKTENRAEDFFTLHNKSCFLEWQSEASEQLFYILAQVKPHISCQEYVFCVRFAAVSLLRGEGNLEKALFFYDENLDFEFSNSFCRLEKETQIFDLYFIQKQYTKALEILDKGILEAQKNGFSDLFIDYTLKKVSIISSFESREKSLILLLKTAELVEKMPVGAKKRAEVWNQLGNTNYAIKNYERAEKSWRKSFLHYLKIPKIGSSLVGCINNIALAIRKQGNLEKALMVYDSALHYATETNHRAWIGIITGNMADIYAEQGDYSKAVNFFQKNIENSYLTNQYDEIPLSYSKLAKCFVHLRQFGQAKNSLDSLDVFLEQMRKNAYEYGVAYVLQINIDKNSAWAEWYAAQGKHTEAYRFQTEYIENYKKLEKLTNQETLNRIQTELEVERKEKENLLLKQQTEEDHEEIRRQRILNMVVVTFLLFFVGVSLVFYRMIKQRQKMNDQLSAQKEEIHSQKEALHTQNGQLEQLNLTKNRLFAIISHDLRSPINNLKGVLEVLDMDLPKEQQKEILQDTTRLMDNTFQTLENLLNWAKWQMGGAHYFPQKVDVEHITHQVCSLLSQTAASKKIELENQMAEETFAWADRDHVELILRNLIGNALKFTPEGGKVRIRGEKIGLEFVQLCVSDSGVGISEERLAKLFDNQKVSSTRGTAGEKGTGLGLVMCKEFVEQNGGNLEVRSRVGEGTTFCFSLPQRK